VVAVGFTFWIRSGDVSGDGLGDPTPVYGVPDEEFMNPFEPYPPGRGAIAYDQLSSADKASVDLILETTEASQPDSSYSSLAKAVDWTSAHTEKLLAARAVGLEGAEQDGVVP
jgi:hypothetical protein